MEQQSTQAIAVVIGLLSGAVLGGTVVWLVLRRFFERTGKEAKAESQREITLLKARLTNAATDLGRQNARLTKLQTEADDLCSRLDVMCDECARLEEQAARVPALEAQLSDSLSQLNCRRDENTRIAAQLRERTQALEALQGRVTALESEQAANDQSLDALRNRLQNEVNRSETLAEQSARVPELEKALNAAEAEKERVNEQLVDLRHQLRTVESALASQRQRAERVESGLVELNSGHSNQEPDVVKANSQLTATDETNTISSSAGQCSEVAKENEAEQLVSGSAIEPKGEANVMPLPTTPLEEGRVATTAHVGPLARGGKPRGLTKSTDWEPPSGAEFLRTKPELICWNHERQWIPALEVPEGIVGDTDVVVFQNDSQLARHEHRQNCWPIASPYGQMLIKWGEFQTAFLFGERRYLLFKLTGKYLDQGRRVKAVSTGSYLVIAPIDWERDETLAGPPSIDPEGVSLPGLRAHFFDLRSEDGKMIAFRDSAGLGIEIDASDAKFELLGNRLPDAQQELGPLFAVAPPRVKALNQQAWEEIRTIVVGEEGAKRRRWRAAFSPCPGSAVQDLPTELASRRCGWYFLRFYNSQDDLVESLDFRFVSGIEKVEIENLQALPSEDGHKPATVRFHHNVDCVVQPADKGAASLEIDQTSKTTVVVIPPDPAFDQTYWYFHHPPEVKVEFHLLIERVWWSQGNAQDPPEQTKKFDKPLTIGRDAFSPLSDSVLYIWFPTVHWAESVLLGFGEDRLRTYRVKVNSRRFSLPLREFGDATEIQDTTRDATLRLWILHGGVPIGGVVIARVLAELNVSDQTPEEPDGVAPVPKVKVVDFCSTCDHARISGGYVWCRRNHWYRVNKDVFRSTYRHNWCDEWRGEFLDDKGNWHMN